VKKDHRENTVGPWAKVKLDLLEEYLEFDCTALSKKNFTRVYIEAFAGAVEAKVRGSDVSSEASPFFDDLEISEAQAEFIKGSPVRALDITHRFHKYYFFDLDHIRAEAIQSRTQGDNSVVVKVCDCNAEIQALTAFLTSPSVRGFAFLDPYGAHLEWKTLKALANTGNMEVLINFPVAMAINRLITKSGDVPETWSAQLNNCFGTDEWREIAYSREVSLFGVEPPRKKDRVPERLLGLYVNRLKELFDFVAPPRLVRNTKNVPLYYLIWAGPNKLGYTGASHIFKNLEKIRLKKKSTRS